MGGGDNKIEETEYEKAQAQVALERWGDYQGIFKPYENKFMGEVDKLNSEANYQRAGELAMSPLAKSFADVGMQAQTQMNRQGVNPNSGKGISQRNELGTAQAGAEVDSISRANMSQQDNYVGGLQNIVAMGQGQAGQAMNGMSDLAQMGQRNAYDAAQTSQSNSNNIRAGVGAAVGAGTRYGLNQTKAPDTTKQGDTSDTSNWGII